mmetsp:Transcript_1559/g.4710  ORF Transcript_1559/g.4710 Transcript_1559/m.4710 type:complete len:202 (+) Transcript_1559:243-848(+)
MIESRSSLENWAPVRSMSSARVEKRRSTLEAIPARMSGISQTLMKVSSPAVRKKGLVGWTSSAEMHREWAAISTTWATAPMSNMRMCPVLKAANASLSRALTAVQGKPSPGRSTSRRKPPPRSKSCLGSSSQPVTCPELSPLSNQVSVASSAPTASVCPLRLCNSLPLPMDPKSTTNTSPSALPAQTTSFPGILQTPSSRT